MSRSRAIRRSATARPTRRSTSCWSGSGPVSRHAHADGRRRRGQSVFETSLAPREQRHIRRPGGSARRDGPRLACDSRSVQSALPNGPCRRARRRAEILEGAGRDAGEAFFDHPRERPAGADLEHGGGAVLEHGFEASHPVEPLVKLAGKQIGGRGLVADDATVEARKRRRRRRAPWRGRDRRGEARGGGCEPACVRRDPDAKPPDMARAPRGLGLVEVERVERPADHDMVGAVDDRHGDAGGRRQRLGLGEPKADRRQHALGRARAGGVHRPAALGHEIERRDRVERPRAAMCGDLAGAVPGEDDGFDALRRQHGVRRQCVAHDEKLGRPVLRERVGPGRERALGDGETRQFRKLAQRRLGRRFRRHGREHVRVLAALSRAEDR